MPNKKGIGYSPLTEKVYMGTQNEAKRMWVGEKTDITDQFVGVAMEFFEPGTIRTVVDKKGGADNLIINIRKDAQNVRKLIDRLERMLNQPEN